MRLPGLRIDGPLDDLPWRSTRHEGVSWIDLGAHEPATAMAVLIRMAPGFGYPRHRHIGPEDVLVLDGAYADDDGRCFVAGEFVRYPAGSAHAPRALDARAGVSDGEARPCVLFAVAHEGTEVLDSAAASDEVQGGRR